LRKNSSRRKKHTSGAEAQTHFQRLNGTSKEGAEKLTWFLAKGALEAGMRGNEDRQEEVFSYIPLEKRVGAEHPLRRLRAMADRALSELGAWFDRLYSQTGRPSIPPEQLLRALILQALYTIRSERQLMDQIDGNWRYRWFVGLKLDEPVWDVTVFTKNRERLMAGEVSQRFFERVVEQAREAGLLDDEHFTVDGSLIGAWASRSSFEKKKDPPQRGSGARGRKMFRDTHESKSDPEARMYHKNRWTPGQPSYLGHVVTENKHGLIVQSCVTEAIKRAEREAGLMMMSKLVAPDGRATVAADTGYQERTFIEGLRALGVIPLVAEYKESKNWPNWLRPSEREHPLFARSQKRRRRIEKVFSWIKGVAGLHRTKFRGRRRVDWIFRLAAAAHNLVRMVKLVPAV
jgi:transposase